MVMVKATKDSEAGKMPDQKLLAAMTKFNEELVNAGIMQAGEGLQPSSRGARVKFSATGTKTLVDGPFAETKELVAGFWLWKVKSRQEAIDWAMKCPAPFNDQECEIELRQVYEIEDFGAVVNAELRAKDQELRARIGKAK
jgi:hypothetical protein